MADKHLNADAAFVFLREVYTREGTDAAVQAAQDMIAAGAAWIAQEHGSDEARRVLQVVGAAQRRSVRWGLFSVCYVHDDQRHKSWVVHTGMCGACLASSG